jgi:hypothetical protein
MIVVVDEIEAHDEVVEWFDELSRAEWERTSVVIARLDRSADHLPVHQ